MNVPETIALDDVEERGPLGERVLFWLLKHPYQRVRDLVFVFQVSPSTICRQLLSLKKHALVESVISAIVSPLRPEALYYLTTRGIERVADLVGGIDPGQLACLWQVSEVDLLRLLPRLHSILSLQDIVQGLIVDAPRQLAYPGGHPATIRWHWQRDYTHIFERKGKHLTCSADGTVVFRRRPLRSVEEQPQDRTESWHCAFLFIDPGFFGGEDLRLMRERLEHLLLWREHSERWSYYHTFPSLLIVAPTAHQRDLWRHCAQDAAVHLRVAPLKGACTVLMKGDSPWHFSWEHLDGSGVIPFASLLEPMMLPAIPPGVLAPKPVGMESKTVEKGGHQIVRGGFDLRAKRLAVHRIVTRKKMTDLSLLSLRYRRRHLDLLLQMYALPLSKPQELAALLRMEESTLQHYLRELLHPFPCIETISTECGKRLVLTETGLRLVSLLLNVPLSHIAERDESPERWQQRGVRQALQIIEHTVGVYTFLAQIQRDAYKTGHEMLWWETTRSLRRYRFQGKWHNLMPDALFEYQAQESRAEAWLEWDTGSMHGPALTVKFEAYVQYVQSKQYRRDHLTLPKLLLVAPHYGREQMIRQVAASVLGSLPLTVWSTNAQLLCVEGPGAPIWRRGGLEYNDTDRSTWFDP